MVRGSRSIAAEVRRAPGRQARAAVGLALAACCLASPHPVTGTEPGAPGKRLVIGVLAFRPKPQTQAAWEPLAAALEAAVPGCSFTVAALDYPELEHAIADHRVDLVITNPGHYVAIHHRQPMSGVLATVVEEDPHGPVEGMAGAVVVRSDRPDLTRLSDLAGARIAAVGADSLGGYQAQVYELVRAGVGAPSRERVRFTGMPHDQVVEAVLSGAADAGFLRAGMVEQLVRGGRLDPARIAVLDRRPASRFPYAASTQLYPGWPVVALAHVDEQLAGRVAAALLGLGQRQGPPLAASFHSFAIPADYAPVEVMMRELRLRPFDGAPPFRLADVLRRYRKSLAFLGALLAVIAALAGLLLRAYGRLQVAHAGRQRLVAELQATLQHVRTLSGLIPICMHCHNIREDSGYWSRIEAYLTRHTGALLSHALCPECARKYHPELDEE
jgi:ABC-type phosphate/phosphonate transport system substrate-binding protein